MPVGRLSPGYRMQVAVILYGTARIQEKVETEARDHGKSQLFSRAGMLYTVGRAVHYANLSVMVHIMICVVGSIWSYEALKTL